MTKRLLWVVLLGGSIYGGTARAETAVKVQSCADALAAIAANQQCVAQYGTKLCSRIAPISTTRCWDFENSLTFDNGFGAWSATGNAFATQPTYGDNVTAWRALQSQQSQITAGKSVLDDMTALGGDYWQTPYPIGHQGDYWLGTYENRSAPWSTFDTTQGDGPTGVMISPEFLIDRDYISFLIGGGCDINTEKLELQVKVNGTFVQALDGNGNPLRKTGRCNEIMAREIFNTDAYSGLRGLTARLVITDASQGGWGHINIDHILVTSTRPNDFNGANRPLWGFADTHAHPGNHETFKATLGPPLITGSPEQVAPCDGGRHGMTTHKGGIFATKMLETESLGYAPSMPEGCAGLQCWFQQRSVDFVGGDEVHDAMHGPQWYSRTHQQMFIDWIKRSYQGGQRIIVATAGNNEAVGSVIRWQHNMEYVSDFGAMRRFHFFMKDLVSRYPWMEIALTPEDARRIVRNNRLAIILAAEVDDIGDHCSESITYPNDDKDGGETTTMSTNGANPWNMVKVKTSCGGDLNAWKARIDSLYQAGYRMVIPMHFITNDLGGGALYSELHSKAGRFANHAFPNVLTSTDVGFRFGEAGRKQNAAAVQYFGQPFDPLAAWNTAELGWCEHTPVGGCAAGGGMGWVNLFGMIPLGMPVISLVVGLMQGAYTPIPIAALMPLPPYNGGGHINASSLTPTGAAVLGFMKERGMIIDVAHMGQLAREAVLGLGSTPSASSVVNPGCDLTTPACQASAYPVIASHAGLRELSRIDTDSDDRNEGGLRADMIERIRVIGGTIASGTAGGDSKSVTEATGPIDPWTGQSWAGIYAPSVANDCAGSSKTFAQGYLYTLRRMHGKGVTIGTDLNGLESQLNPRFGTMGCYARGNIPHVVKFAYDGATLIDRPSIYPNGGVPFNFRRAKLTSFLKLGTAGGQREQERDFGSGLNYAHYNNQKPVGGPGTKLQYMTLLDPPAYWQQMSASYWWHGQAAVFQTNSMSMLSTSSPLTALRALPAMIGPTTISPTDPNARTFDFNYDGLANYGLLPDLFQDTRATGMTREQLGPLFLGAESVVQAWEKSCRLSSSAVNMLGCN